MPRAALTAVLATLTVVSAVMGGVSAASAAPGTPGVPQPNTVVFAEDFENGPGISPQLLTDYIGDDGERYTADAPWLTGCNGIIANFSIPVSQLGNCVLPDSSAALRQLALALGVHGGATDPSANDVVAAYTENNPGAGVEFATVDAIDLAGSTGRFLTFSVDAAALNCRVSAPQYQFALVDGAGAVTQVGGTVNACASSSTVAVPAVGPAPSRPVSVGTYASDGSFLFDGASLGVRFTNVNGSGAGNDAAFDNVRILDVTPQLDQSFEPATTLSGTTSDLTVTITNTDELAAKNGWSFTETLPTGLTIADDSAATTCPDATLSAAEGGTSFRLAGDLDEDLASCTVTLPVTSPVAGTFTSRPSDFDSIGLNQPAAASVEFVDPAPALSVVKTSSLAQGERYAAGQGITYSFAVTNTGNVPLTDVEVDDTRFSGSGTLSAVSCPPTAASLAPGASVTCTASYSTTQADVDRGEIRNSAIASATAPGGQTVESAPSQITLMAAEAAPGLSVLVSADAAAQRGLTPGQTVTFSFQVANTGNVTLSDVTVIPTSFSGAGALSDVDCPLPPTGLAPGAQITCSASYTAQQADVAAGSLSLTVTSSGSPPDPESPTVVSAAASAVVPVTAPAVVPAPGLAPARTASAGAPTLADTGAEAPTALAGGGVVALVVGLVLVASRRRRSL